jgi:hypothetical protein
MGDRDAYLQIGWETGMKESPYGTKAISYDPQ